MGADEASSAGDQDPHVCLHPPKLAPTESEINGARSGAQIPTKQNKTKQAARAYLEELGEAERRGRGRRARGGAVAIGLLLRHGVEHLDPPPQTKQRKSSEIPRSKTERDLSEFKEMRPPI